MSKKLVMRNQERIIVIGQDNNFEIIDGNRRSWQALLVEQTSIPAAVGRIIKTPAIFNCWISTALLMDLIGFIKRIDRSKNTVNHFTKTIARLIRDSEAGQYEFFHRVTLESDNELREKVHAYLKKS